MNIVAWVVRTLSAMFSLFPRQKRVVFMSRQAHRPLEFVLLEPWIKRMLPEHRVVWCCVRRSGRLGPLTMLRQLWLQATSSLCVVDGYVPAVCIPRDFGGGKATKSNSSTMRSSGVKRADFSERVYRHRGLAPVVQVWHALGAVKKFGYQALDTPDGRSSQTAEILAMHRGYDVVAAGLRGTVNAFSQAFDCSKSRVRVLGSPRVDYLISDTCAQLRKKSAAEVARRLQLEWRLSDELAPCDVSSSSDGALGLESAQSGTAVSQHGPVVLYAPTYRKHPADPEWHARHVEALRNVLPESATLIVSGHPLDSFDDVGSFAEPLDSAPKRSNIECRRNAKIRNFVKLNERKNRSSRVRKESQGDQGSTKGVYGDKDTRVCFLESVESIHALSLVNYVVTDYSAVAFEAMLADVKVLFYVPDIDAYRVSPGLNVDPERELGSLSFRDAKDLGRYILQDWHEDRYDREVLTAFERAYGIDEARKSRGGACRRIATTVAILANESSASIADTPQEI